MRMRYQITSKTRHNSPQRSCQSTFNILPIAPFHGNSGFPSTRTNLSPFTKDFRGGEQLNESID